VMKPALIALAVILALLGTAYLVEKVLEER
jgi:hypothetical protein